MGSTSVSVVTFKQVTPDIGVKPVVELPVEITDPAQLHCNANQRTELLRHFWQHHGV